MEVFEPDTISDAGVTPGQFLVIHIGDAKQSQTISGDTVRTKNSEFWFFQVADRSNLIQSPITLFDASGNALGPISAGSGQDYTQLFDTNGDDILRNEDNPWRTYHISVAVEQNDIRIYPRIPDGQNGGGWDYLTGSEPDPTNGDDFGYVSASNTDPSDPPTELETIVWKQDAQTDIQYGFFNEGDVSIDPLITVKGFAYELRPVVEEDAKLQLLADVGKNPGDRDQGTRIVDFSRQALRSFSFEVPNEWKNAQNTFTVSRANLPEEIEESLEEGESGSSTSSSSGNTNASGAMGN